MSASDGIPTISDYLGIFRTYWWLVTAGIVLGVLFGLIMNAQAVTSFQARSEVLIHTLPAGGELREAGSQARLVETAAHLAESGIIEQRVEAMLDRSDVPGVNAVAAPGADVLELMVQDGDATTAIRTVNAYASVLSGSAELSLVEKPVVITEADAATEVGRSNGRSGVVYGFVGLVIGAGAALAMRLRGQSPR